jgi:hypothetical protein
LPKESFSNFFSEFSVYKKVISPNFDNFLDLQMYFWGGCAMRLCRNVPKEGGRVLAGPAPCSQTVRTYWKISTKSEYIDFTLMEKCTQLLLIEGNRQSQKFYKPSNYILFLVFTVTL